MLAFDVSLAHYLERPLLRTQIIASHFEFHLLVHELLLLFVEVGLLLFELVEQALAICLEEADLLALNLIKFTLLLDLLGKAIKLILLRAVALQLLLKSIALAHDLSLDVVESSLALLEGLLFFALLAHLVLRRAQLGLELLLLRLAL